MKRALIITLLFFFLADAVGLILYLYVDWYEVRKEMNHLLASDEFKKKAISLTLEKDEFEKIRWVEINHEFYYDGKLYDMKSLVRSPDGKTKIRCVEDEKEAELFEHMGQMIDLSQSSQEHQRTFVLSVFKFLSELTFHFFSFPCQNKSISCQTSDGYLNHYHFSFYSVLVQPPDHVPFSI